MEEVSGNGERKKQDGVKQMPSLRAGGGGVGTVGPLFQLSREAARADV